MNKVDPRGIRIVLVHLGKKIPSYALDNIKRLSVNFPNFQITLIHEKSEKCNFEKYENVSDFIYDRDLNRTPPELDLSFDPKFRNGYWRFTIERFYALAQLHNMFPEEKFLHIESDILLFPNFPFSLFREIELLSWMEMDSIRDIGAIVFSPNAHETDWLCSQITMLLRENGFITDMKILNLISRKDSNRVCILPTTKKGFGLLPNSVSKANNLSISTRNSELFSRFGGFFDAASVGMWLVGIDPRNNYGKTIIRNTDGIIKGGTYLDPSTFNYVVDQRDYLYITIESEEFPVWNLHIHTKDRLIFRDLQNKKLKKLVKESAIDRGLTTKFNIVIFLRLLRENFLNGTLIKYLAFSPIFSSSTYAVKKALESIQK